MSDSNTRAFIQVRMNSSRYPGKSLAPLGGVPVIKRVIDCVTEAVPQRQVTVLTTDNIAEDPLVAYLSELGVDVFRGHPTNVFVRFQSAVEEYPCDHFFRICGDSPFLEPSLFTKAMNVLQNNEESYDVITNTHPNQFPSGKRVELVDGDTFSSIDDSDLNESQREHVTKIFYDQSKEYNIYNIDLPNDSHDRTVDGFAVDRVSDLRRLEEALTNNALDENPYKVTKE